MVVPKHFVVGELAYQSDLFVQFNYMAKTYAVSPLWPWDQIATNSQDFCQNVQ